MSTRLQGTAKVGLTILGVLVFLWWLFAKTTFMAWTMEDDPYRTIATFSAGNGQPFTVDLLLNIETNKCYYWINGLQSGPHIEQVRCPI